MIGSSNSIHFEFEPIILYWNLCCNGLKKDNMAKEIRNEFSGYAKLMVYWFEFKREV